MKFTVEQWHPEYGSPMEDMDEEELRPQIDPNLELPAESWVPLSAGSERAAKSILFVDGVRRIDARVWLDRGGYHTMGLCATCAAGVVRCDGAAQIQHSLVHRMLIAPSPDEGITTRHAEYAVYSTVDDAVNSLMNGLARGLSQLEVRAAEMAGTADLIAVDGPLRGREGIRGAIGYVKTHRRPYLQAELAQVVSELGPGQRTPVFLLETSWVRYSWYLRLPYGKGHPWAGIVRCEAPPNLSRFEVADLADVTAASFPAYASRPHKDPRAPQNLYPIAGLENYLRGLLGNHELLYRDIAVASAPTAGSDASGSTEPMLRGTS